MKIIKLTLLCLMVAVATLFAVSHADAATIDVSDMVTEVVHKNVKGIQIIPESKRVEAGETMRVVYQGPGVKKWKLSFSCPKGTSVFLDDENLCEGVKNFGRSKDAGFAIPLRFVNTNPSAKLIKLRANAYDERGKYHVVRETVKIGKED